MIDLDFFARLLTQRIRKFPEACNFLIFEIFYIEMKHPNCYIILRLTLLAYNAHIAMYLLLIVDTSRQSVRLAIGVSLS